MKTLILLIFSVAITQAADDPSNFYGSCVVRISGQPEYITTCHLQDLPNPMGVYWNYWSITIDYAPSLTDRPRYAEWMRSESIKEGTLRWSSILTGSLEITPYDYIVRKSIAARAGGMECRAQNISINTNADNSVTMTFDEPKNDEATDNGMSPLQDWILRNIAAHQLYGYVPAQNAIQNSH